MKYKLKQITTVTPDPIVELPDGAIVISATSERYLYPPINKMGSTVVYGRPKGYVRTKIIKSWTIYYLEPVKEKQYNV